MVLVATDNHCLDGVPKGWVPVILTTLRAEIPLRRTFSHQLFDIPKQSLYKKGRRNA